MLSEKTIQERIRLGKLDAQRDYARITIDYDGYRITGNPGGGHKRATPQKISLLKCKKKVSEINCGYATYYDCGYFCQMSDLVYAHCHPNG